MNQLFLHLNYVLYIGVSFDTVLHKHHAAQICIGLESPFQLLNEKGVSVTCRAAIITANTAHQLQAHDTNIASLYLDVQSDVYQQLLNEYDLNDEQAIQSLTISPELFTSLVGLYCEERGEYSAKAVINQILNEFINQSTNKVNLDQRVLSVLQQLDNHIESQIPIDDLAASINLSTSRLAHLFKSNLGIPIRRYSLWRRIRFAIKHAIEHQSLTEGAHFAGFADSAHFSRVFKEMYGITPSMIVNKHFPIKLFFE